MPTRFFDKCTDDAQENFRFGTQTSYDVFITLRSVFVAAVFTATCLIFYRSWANCPRIVIKLWLLIDSAAVFNLLAQIFWNYDRDFYDQEFAD